ncbi:DUF1799 domain-containing protein [Thalassomonas viridans]|uniref:DUF1799 domain-containing protein n=1 Tax=Thalassomonas viridans TaxID=137584 RepID=A0AAE9Z638_9GAMM|nr:DUF1799 domain-containing protein [Thalassomonas viridans]WDE07293.1 DUF1799 domain-containing protein [Thalassomonas viridans]
MAAWDAPAKLRKSIKKHHHIQELDDVAVWPENTQLLCLFMYLDCKWHRNAMSGAHESLRWDAVETAIRRWPDKEALSQYGDENQVFWLLVNMERWALSALNEIRAQQKENGDV